MAKAKDLAGLAALGALGYMLNKKGDKDDAGKLADSSSYAPPSKMNPIRGVGDATNDVATNGSSYATRSNMTPMQGVGDATNNPLVKPRAQSSSDMSESVTNNKPPASPSARSDQLSAVSRASKREAKTKQFAQDTPEELSAQKTDSLAVSSRAARAADARKRMAKASSYKSGGMTSSASSRADGIATKGKTRGKIC